MMIVKYNCGPACRSCEMFTVEGRCQIDPDAIPVWKEGDLDAMFTKLTSEPYKSKYDVEILSNNPWIITMENVLSDEEAERFIELGGIGGYQPSTTVGSKKPDGSHEEALSKHRTSHNAWCQIGCKNDTMVVDVKDRLAGLIDIPANNGEFIQLLRYEEGQFYKVSFDVRELRVQLEDVLSNHCFFIETATPRLHSTQSQTSARYAQILETKR